MAVKPERSALTLERFRTGHHYTVITDTNPCAVPATGSPLGRVTATVVVGVGHGVGSA